MNRKIYVIALLLFTAFIFGGISYAGGGRGGMGAGSGSGGMGAGMGGDYGMMGGQSHGMMGSGQNYSNSRSEQPRTNQTYQYEKKRHKACERRSR